MKIWPLWRSVLPAKEPPWPPTLHIMLKIWMSGTWCTWTSLLDALLSPSLNPLEGSTMYSCGKLGLGGRSRLPALKGVEGRARSPGIRLGRDQAIWSRICIQNQHKLVRTHSACIWCWDKPRANSDSHDTPRPGLGRCHHHPPYSIFCASPSHLHPNGTFSRDSQSGVLKLS
jgi:hypothetical protein